MKVLHLCLSETVLVKDVHSLVNHHQTNFSSRISSYLQLDLSFCVKCIHLVLHLNLELKLKQEMQCQKNRPRWHISYCL